MRQVSPLLVALVLGLCSVARAQQPGSTEGAAAHRDEARELAKQGLAKLDAGDAKGAIALFEQAEAKFHAPTHLLYLAQANASLGDAVKAARLYQKLLAEDLPNYAPDAFREAQKIGRAELEALGSSVGRVRVRGAARNLAVDGEPVTTDVWYVAPGSHQVTFEGGSKGVTVAAGAEAVVEVAAEPPKLPPPPGEPDAGGLGALKIGGIVAMSIGGAATIAGAATGALSLSKVDQLDDRCPSKRNCAAADQPLADDARALGNASTALLVIGGAAFVTGLILVLVPEDEPAASAQSGRIEPLVGPGFAGLTLSF